MFNRVLKSVKVLLFIAVLMLFTALDSHYSITESFVPVNFVIDVQRFVYKTPSQENVDEAFILVNNFFLIPIAALMYSLIMAAINSLKTGIADLKTVTATILKNAAKLVIKIFFCSALTILLFRFLDLDDFDKDAGLFVTIAYLFVMFLLIATIYQLVLNKIRAIMGH